ncbi:MAG: hypothetical protein M1827_004690 [Pycnora praestabilis]|nr:MAG: hypothetical protein M1827_004690 [Pycnora praestabilis]
MSTAGPELPPHLLAKRKRQAEENEEGRKTELPVISTNRSVTPEGTEKRRRIVGPSLPPASLDERPPEILNRQGQDSSDDDFGPALPPQQGQALDHELEAERRVAAEEAAARQAARKPQREEWMLVPPKQDDWSSKVDPTKLRNRKFNTGKGSKAPASKSGGDELWTETPEQKRQRLEDEVMGVKRPATLGSEDKRNGKSDAEMEKTARRIQEYNDKNRNKSLYDEHKKAVPKEKEDDPSKRAFDKEKDMGLGQKIGHAQKKDLLHRAADFGSRFAGGNYL